MKHKWMKYMLAVLLAGALTLAAQQPADPEEQFQLAEQYFSGQGVPKHVGKALDWYRRAAEQGHATAQTYLGSFYAEGEIVPQDFEEAVKWYRMAAEQDFDQAQFNMGLMYLNGHGVEQNGAEAVGWFRKSADQGNASAQNSLGIVYYQGQGVPQSYSNSAKWFRKAAEQGHPKAQSMLGVMYVEGLGIGRNPRKAIKLFREAAEQNFPEAQFNLARAHLTGVGTKPNAKKAAKFFQQAAQQNHVPAQTALGRMYDAGIGIRKNHGQAMQWLRRAADAGDASAQLTLGSIYERGESEPRNFESAVKWYSLAADQGNIYAQASLGVLLINGRGAPRESLRGARLLRTGIDRMIEEGVKAPIMLFIHYASYPGRSGIADDPALLKSVQQAARDGDEEAQYLLGQVYEDGLGVPKDPVQAYLWKSLSAAGGNSFAEGDPEKLAAEMTPEQIDQAERLVKEWRVVSSESGARASSNAPPSRPDPSDIPAHEPVRLKDIKTVYIEELPGDFRTHVETEMRKTFKGKITPTREVEEADAILTGSGETGKHAKSSWIISRSTASARVNLLCRYGDHLLWTGKANDKSHLMGRIGAGPGRVASRLMKSLAKAIRKDGESN